MEIPAPKKPPQNGTFIKGFCMAFYAKVQNRKNHPRRIYTPYLGVFLGIPRFREKGRRADFRSPSPYETHIF